MRKQTRTAYVFKIEDRKLEAISIYGTSPGNFQECAHVRILLKPPDNTLLHRQETIPTNNPGNLILS